MLIKLAKEIEGALKEKKSIKWQDHFDLTNGLVQVMLDFPEKPEGTFVKVERPKTYSKVILVSGGMDSTIMWWLNRATIDKVGLYVNLGHKYTELEINAIKTNIDDFQIVDYPLDFGEEWKHIIPTRNFVLIALATELCSHEGEIWLGAVQGESADDKGDKSELFFKLVEEYIWRTKHKKVYIKTLKDKTKNDWLKEYLETTNDLMILDTITCFAGTLKPCGRCQGCVRKWIAMRYAGLEMEDFFEVNPYIGGKEYVDKYKIKLEDALENNDFRHYSYDRAKQDLQVIKDYEKTLN